MGGGKQGVLQDTPVKGVMCDSVILSDLLIDIDISNLHLNNGK